MSPSNLPVPVGPLVQHDDADGAHASAFDAHVLGQDGRKRGLRGGPPVLKAARAAYLGTEYSGPGERRLPPGVVAAKTV